MRTLQRIRPVLGVLALAALVGGCAGSPVAPPAENPASTDDGQVWLSADQRLYYYPPVEGEVLGYDGHNVAGDVFTIIVLNATVLSVTVDEEGELVTVREQGIYNVDIEGETLNIPWDATHVFRTNLDGSLQLPASRLMAAADTVSGDAWVVIPSVESLQAGRPFRDSVAFTLGGGDAALDIAFDYTVTALGRDDDFVDVQLEATGTSTLRGDAQGSALDITVVWEFQPGFGFHSERTTVSGDGISSDGTLTLSNYPVDIESLLEG